MAARGLWPWLAVLSLLFAISARAQQSFPGVTNSEIVLGQTMPYSGPLAPYAVIGKVEAAYFAMLNEQGGIKGRKIRLISLDDGYDPAKTLEQTRKLVGQEQVLLDFSPFGTPTNLAVRRYLNEVKVPQLFVVSASTVFGDPEHFHWTMGWQPTLAVEGEIYARYTLEAVSAPRVAILYEDSSFAREYVGGFKHILGSAAASLIVKEIAYKPSGESIESDIAALKATQANVFLDLVGPGSAAKAVGSAYKMGWKPVHFLDSFASTDAALSAAGREPAQGIISARYLKDVSDPRWRGDAGMRAFLGFMSKYAAGIKPEDPNAAYGYSVAQTMADVLRRAGSNLSRENVMRQAASLDGLELPLLLPGIRIYTRPTSYVPIDQMQLVKREDKGWTLFGEPYPSNRGMAPCGDEQCRKSDGSCGACPKK